MRLRVHGSEPPIQDAQSGSDMPTRINQLPSFLTLILLPLGLTLIGITIGYSVAVRYVSSSKLFRSKHRQSPPTAVLSTRIPPKDGARKASALHLKMVSESPAALHTDHNFCDEVEYYASPLDFSHSSYTTQDQLALPTPLLENMTVTGVVPLGSYDYFQLCVATHPEHHHRIELTLVTQDSDPGHATKTHSFNADLYISINEPHPTFERNTWISAHAGSVDAINLSTYLDEFIAAPDTSSGRGKVLYVGVYGRSALSHGIPDESAIGVPYSLTAAIRNVEPKVLAKRSALRGGEFLRAKEFERVSERAS